MISIIGIVIVLGAICAGYMMEHGNFAVLFQPAELVIIFGAAVGTVVIANPLPTLIKIGKGMAGVFRYMHIPRPCTWRASKCCTSCSPMRAKRARRNWKRMSIIPIKSPVFTKYPKFLKSHHALHFLCDTLRTAVSGGVDPMEIDSHDGSRSGSPPPRVVEPIAALNTMADALPGLGIVAAVLGVVLTMGALGGPKEAIGEKVAAALVGTFLGILLCYGILAHWPGL